MSCLRCLATSGMMRQIFSSALRSWRFSHQRTTLGSKSAVAMLQTWALRTSWSALLLLVSLFAVYTKHLRLQDVAML